MRNCEQKSSLSTVDWLSLCVSLSLSGSKLRREFPSRLAWHLERNATTQVHLQTRKTPAGSQRRDGHFPGFQHKGTHCQVWNSFSGSRYRRTQGKWEHRKLSYWDSQVLVAVQPYTWWLWASRLWNRPQFTPHRGHNRNTPRMWGGHNSQVPIPHKGSALGGSWHHSHLHHHTKSELWFLGKQNGGLSLRILKDWSSEQKEFYFCQQQEHFQEKKRILWFAAAAKTFETTNASQEYKQPQ